DRRVRHARRAGRGPRPVRRAVAHPDRRGERPARAGRVGLSRRRAGRVAVPSTTGGGPRPYGRPMTRSIDAAALDAAERFVRRDARLLDRHRFAHQFRGGPAGAVVAALVPYANPDGGFGNALEPDLRGAASQPEAVAVALRVLDELAPAPGDPDPFAHQLVG